MAEFSEVIRQTKRLCKRVCDRKCVLSINNNGRNVSCTNLINDYPEEYEAIVMKWAKEHPEMTNKQKMMEIITEAFGAGIIIRLLISIWIMMSD